MFVPWMTPIETILILKLLRPHHTMLEWGSGGSTILFSPFVKQYYSIEHKKEWFDTLIKELIKYKRTNVILNLEEVINEKTGDFENYIRKVEKLNIPKFDIVLIDGRRRVHCAREVLPFIDYGSYVILHDASREKYQSILNYYEVKAKTKNLYIMQRKNG